MNIFMLVCLAGWLVGEGLISHLAAGDIASQREFYIPGIIPLMEITPQKTRK